MIYLIVNILGFAGLVIGFLMCCSSAIAPYWLHQNVTVQLDNDTLSYYEGDIGLWLFHLSNPSKREYHFFPAEMRTYRTTSVINVILSLSCVLVILCPCYRHYAKHYGYKATIFCAGAAGFVTIIAFVLQIAGSDIMINDYTFKGDYSDYAWAFYVYIAGTVLLTLTSFLMFFNQHKGDHVVSNPA